VASVVKVLAHAVEGWAAYLPADGSVETVFPHAARQVLPQLRRETLRIGLTGTHAAATFPLLGRDVIEYSIVVDRRTAGFLAVSAGRPLRKADRQLMLTGVLLLAVTAQREWQVTRANSVQTATVATLILNGFVDAARLVAADPAGAPLAERVQVLAVHGENVGATSTAELAEQLVAVSAGEQASRLRDRIRGARLRCTIDGYAYLILESDPAASGRRSPGVRAASSPTASSPTASSPTASSPTANGPTVDGSVADNPTVDGAAVDGGLAPAPQSRFRAALSRSILITQAAASMAELRDWCSLASAGQIMTEELSRSRAAMRRSAEESQAEQWVAVLASYSRADLLETVTSYLRHQGQWEVVARELGLHRNSVRHRIGVATQLIGVVLDDPDVAANLWLALRAKRF
jgi:purine catabolism regulator